MRISSMCSLVTELYVCIVWRAAATLFLVMTCQNQQCWSCFLLVCVFLCRCFCLGESFAQCFGALGSVGVHMCLYLWQVSSFDDTKAMPACAAACYPGAKLAHWGSFIFPVNGQKEFIWAFRVECNFLFPFFFLLKNRCSDHEDVRCFNS